MAAIAVCNAEGDRVDMQALGLNVAELNVAELGLIILPFLIGPRAGMIANSSRRLYNPR
jgi:hypothetical protein